AGRNDGVAAEVSTRCRRLPARRSIFAPTPSRLLARPASRTRTAAWRVGLALRHRFSPLAVSNATRSTPPSPSKSADASARGDASAGAGAPALAGNARAVTSV